MATSFPNQCKILSELWIGYRDDEQFEEFIKYNDLGLPLAYCVAENLIKLGQSEKPSKYISEAFDALLEGLDLDDTGFCCLEKVLQEWCECDD